MQDYYLTDININAPSVDVLRNVLTSYFNITSIKEYYSAKPDDHFVRIFYPNEKLQKPTSMRICIDTINASLLPYLEYVSKQCNQKLEMDVRVYDDDYDPFIWLGHYLFTHDAKYEMFDQEDYEYLIDIHVFEGDDNYEIVYDHFNWDDEKAYKMNLVDKEAPIEYGEKLLFPAELIPEEIKKELEHDPMTFKEKLEGIIQERRPIHKEEK